jgi:hypothetical protein
LVAVTGTPQALMTVEGGRLELDAVVVDGAAGVGIGLSSGASASMRDVLITGVATGLRADGAQVTAIDGLSIKASDVGLWWRGQREPSWTWHRLSLQAPRQVQGIEAPGGVVDGARAERLVQIPGSKLRSP